MVKLRVTQPNVPLAAVLAAFPGMGTCRSAPRLARALDRWGWVSISPSSVNNRVTPQRARASSSLRSVRFTRSATDAATTSLAAFNAISPSAARVAPQSSCSSLNPIVGEIMSPKGSWRPHARRPSRSSRPSNDPYFGAIRFKPVLRTWLARRRHPRYTTDVAPRESNADHWITAPSPCWVIDACIRGSSDKAITHIMVI